MMTSVFDLHKLTPEQRRLHDLGNFVFNRHRLLDQGAKEIYSALNNAGFDYTLQEIQNAIHTTHN